MLFGFFNIASLLVCSSCLTYEEDRAIPKPPETPFVFKWDGIADSSTRALNQHFWNSTGKYYNNASPSDNKFGYWPQAHALDVLIDAYLRTDKNNYYKAYMDNWFVGVHAKNANSFLNEFYDDMEWNGLAMLRTYQATEDPKWLDASTTVWNDIKGGWNDTMGGGIAWRKSQLYYKNTPANAPASILAARLYKLNNNPDDLEWSKKIYDWLKATLVNPTTGLVYDGINSNNDGVREESPGWNFAYNQGTFIGAALELYTITNESVYLSDAIKTADNMIKDNVMSPGGIMRQGDNGDGGLFNGIGVRYLTLLILDPNLPEAKRQTYVTYLKTNAETLWLKGTDRERVLHNNNWTTMPGETGYLNPHLSGVMLMEAMAILDKNNYLQEGE